MICTFAVCYISFLSRKRCDGLKLHSEGWWQFYCIVSMSRRLSLKSACDMGSSELRKAVPCVCSALTPLAKQREGVDIGKSSVMLLCQIWGEALKGRNSNGVWPSKEYSRILSQSSWTLQGTWKSINCQLGTHVRSSTQ